MRVRERDGVDGHAEAVLAVPLDAEVPDDLGHEDGDLLLGEPPPDAHARAVAEGQVEEGVEALPVGLEPPLWAEGRRVLDVLGAEES